MSEWQSVRDTLTERFVGKVEIRYRDKYGVTRTAQGFNFPPFGVDVKGVDGSTLPGAERNMWNELVSYVPYGRILHWREAEAQTADN